MGKLECPYPTSVFTMTEKEYVKAVPDDLLRTRISGYLMRCGWKVAVSQINKAMEENMSGGHFDYRDRQVRELVVDVVRELKKDSKILSKLTKDVGTWLTDLIHEMDYHYAGDTEIDDFKKTESKYLKRLKSLTSKYIGEHYEVKRK